jgi:hypothetical protein
MSTWTSERARIAAITRGIRAGERKPDDPELVEARRNLAALRLAEHVAKVVAAAPPLSQEQRERIVALLRAGGVA